MFQGITANSQGLQYLTSVRLQANEQLEAVHSFNRTALHPFDDISFAKLSFRVVAVIKKQVPCENECEKG